MNMRSLVGQQESLDLKGPLSFPCIWDVRYADTVLILVLILVLMSTRGSYEYVIEKEEEEEEEEEEGRIC